MMNSVLKVAVKSYQYIIQILLNDNFFFICSSRIFHPLYEFTSIFLWVEYKKSL